MHVYLFVEDLTLKNAKNEISNKLLEFLKKRALTDVNNSLKNWNLITIPQEIMSIINIENAHFKVWNGNLLIGFDTFFSGDSIFLHIASGLDQKNQIDEFKFETINNNTK